jgi:hypothetical protein
MPPLPGLSWGTCKAVRRRRAPEHKGIQGRLPMLCSLATYVTCAARRCSTHSGSGSWMCWFTPFTSTQSGPRSGAGHIDVQFVLFNSRFIECPGALRVGRFSPIALPRPEGPAASGSPALFRQANEVNWAVKSNDRQGFLGDIKIGHTAYCSASMTKEASRLAHHYLDTQAQTLFVVRYA